MNMENVYGDESNFPSYSTNYSVMPYSDPSNVAIQSLTAQEAASLGSIMSSGASNSKNSNKTHLRKAAGQVWSDPTLEDWPSDDYRIFCGDLGNEVTDEVLSNAFRKFSSFQRAKVIRDKRSGKSRGYGFVSFGAPEDMLSALKTMNKKYVGNRPIRVMRSKWKDRDINSEHNKQFSDLLSSTSTASKTLRKFKKSGISKKKADGTERPIIPTTRRGRGYFGQGGSARLAHYQYGGIKKPQPQVNKNF